MNQRAPKDKTTRLFSVQLADHDHYFAPKQKRRRRMQWLALIKYSPAFFCFLFPSYHLGVAVFKDPGVKIPESLIRGDAFTLPGDDEDLVPIMNGRKMMFIDGKNPIYLAVTPKGPNLEISYDFLDTDERSRLKALVPKPKHPTYPLFVKQVRVLETPVALAAVIGTQAPVSLVSPPQALPSLASTLAFEVRPAPSLTETELNELARKDGKARLRCWKEPHVDPLAVDLIKRRRLHMGSIQTAGQGEVVLVTPLDGPSGPEFSLLIYHGGGLFTRYWNLVELRVRKGTKVNTGQIIGNVALAQPLNLRKGKQERLTPATWAPVMGGANGLAPAIVNAQSLLAVSSQLCDSK
jgi:hypothetical protein